MALLWFRKHVKKNHVFYYIRRHKTSQMFQNVPFEILLVCFYFVFQHAAHVLNVVCRCTLVWHKTSVRLETFEG